LLFLSVVLLEELIIQNFLEFGLVVLPFGDATLYRDSIASFSAYLQLGLP